MVAFVRAWPVERSPDGNAMDRPASGVARLWLPNGFGGEEDEIPSSSPSVRFAGLASRWRNGGGRGGRVCIWLLDLLTGR